MADMTTGTFRLEWGDPSILSTVFANQAQALRTESDVYLIFGETVPPNVQAINNNSITTLEIKPVVRIALPAGAFDAIARVIATTAGLIKPAEAEE